MALARNHIIEPTKVAVTQAMPLGSDLLVCSFKSTFGDNTVHLDDIYNCSDEEARKAILACTADAPVECVVVPDSSDDKDGHPSINLA